MFFSTAGADQTGDYGINNEFKNKLTFLTIASVLWLSG